MEKGAGILFEMKVSFKLSALLTFFLFNGSEFLLLGWSRLLLVRTESAVIDERENTQHERFHQS